MVCELGVKWVAYLVLLGAVRGTAEDLEGACVDMEVRFLELEKGEGLSRTLDNVQVGVPLAIGILVAAHAGITLKVNEGSISRVKSISHPYNETSIPHSRIQHTPWADPE